MSEPTFRPLAIIGYGCVFPPDAYDTEAYWRTILEGTKGICASPSHRWRWELYYSADKTAEDKTYCKYGAFIPEYRFPYDRLGIDRETVRGFNRTQLMILDASLQALAMAGYTAEQVAGRPTGFYAGNMLGDEALSDWSLHFRSKEMLHHIRSTEAFRTLPPAVQENIGQEFMRRLSEQYPKLEDEQVKHMFQTSLARSVAERLGLSGPSLVLDAACASGLVVLDVAARALQDGSVDTALVAGTMGNMGVSGNVAFSKIGGLSPTHSTPMDARADGLIPGEGVGLILVKRLEDAVRKGDRIRGVIRGVASRCDGKGKGIYAPSSRGQVAAMRRALEVAGVEPGGVQYVEAHMTSTPTGDAVEFTSLKEVYKECPRGSVALGSVKSQIGHTFSAAGIANLIKVLMGMERGTMPPTHDYISSPPHMEMETSPFAVSTVARPWPANGTEPRRACANAFGFGGINSSVCFEEYLPDYHRRMAETWRRVPVHPAAAEPIAIVGIGCVTQGAVGARELVAGAGRTAMAGPFPEKRWHPATTAVYGDGQVGQFIQDLAFPWQKYRIPPKVLAQIDRSQLMALMAADEALTDAGEESAQRENMGVFLGATAGLEAALLANLRIRLVEYQAALESVPEFAALPPATKAAIVDGFLGEARKYIPKTGEDTLPGYMDNIVAGRLANVLDMRSVNLAVDAGSDSFAAALETAVRYLRTGECTSALVGGAHANLAPEFFHLTDRYAAQHGADCPYCGTPAADLVPAEGAAFFVMKRLADVGRTDKVYAVIDDVQFGPATPRPAGHTVCCRSQAAGDGHPFYYGAQGAFLLLRTALALKHQTPALVGGLPGETAGLPAVIHTAPMLGGDYFVTVESLTALTARKATAAQAQPAAPECSTLYLGASTWEQLLAQAEELQRRLDSGVTAPEALPDEFADSEYRLGLVYTTPDELQRKLKVVVAAGRAQGGQR